MGRLVFASLVLPSKIPMLSQASLAPGERFTTSEDILGFKSSPFPCLIFHAWQAERRGICLWEVENAVFVCGWDLDLVSA